MKKLAIATLITTLAAPSAFALGDTERDVLKGILGTLAVQQIWNGGNRGWNVGNRGVYIPPHTYGQDVYGGYGSYNQFPRFVCSSADPVACSYERGRYERAREEYNRARQRAYQCGRTGQCN